MTPEELIALLQSALKEGKVQVHTIKAGGALPQELIDSWREGADWTLKRACGEQVTQRAALEWLFQTGDLLSSGGRTLPDAMFLTGIKESIKRRVKELEGLDSELADWARAELLAKDPEAFA